METGPTLEESEIIYPAFSQLLSSQQFRPVFLPSFLLDVSFPD